MGCPLWLFIAIQSQTAVIDTLGSVSTCLDSIRSLRRRSCHVQVGLMVGVDAAPAIPMGRVVAYQLELLRSLGMPDYRVEAVFGLMTSGSVQPCKLIQRRIPLAASIKVLIELDRFVSPGVTVILAAD